MQGARQVLGVEMRMEMRSKVEYREEKLNMNTAEPTEERQIG